MADRLGSLTNTKTEDTVTSPNHAEGTDGGVPLIQRTAILQKDEKGYGLTVSGDNPVYVASVKQDGAAAKAGVHKGDKIIKVNGKLVTNSNHTEVVKMIKSGSYVALTLLGKPSGHSNRDSTVSDTPSIRDSFANKITAPLPVDAEMDQELRQSKANTIRQMHTQASEELEKLKSSHRGSTSEKYLTQLADKEKTVKALLAQLRQVTDSQNLDSESLSSLQHHQKHMKHSSAPVPSQDVCGPLRTNISRSKSDVSSRKNPLAPDNPALSLQGYRRTESSPEVSSSKQSIRKIPKSESFKSHFCRHALRRKSNSAHRGPSKSKSLKSKMRIRKTSSMPTAVSDIGSMSDSPHTSPSTSPTPQHPQNTHNPDMPHDSGIDDGSQGSVNTVMQNRIIGIDDDDFNSEDEITSIPVSPFLLKLQHLETADSTVFTDLKLLESRPAHMSIFLHYVLTHHDPSPVLFHYVAGMYNTTSGHLKDVKKWAYEIYSTFIILNAPLKVTLDDFIVQEIERTLQFRGDKEEPLRSVFHVARNQVQPEVSKLLEDLRQKKEQGLIEGSNEVRDTMEKAEELKVIERYLVPDLEKALENPDDEKFVAQSWAIATFLRQAGLMKQSQHSSTVLERTQSFISKDKKVGFKSINKAKSKNQKGHNFVQQHFHKTEHCMLCNRVLWGVGFQGFQCQTCDQCIHKGCLEDLEETCSKKKNKGGRTSGIFKKPLPVSGGGMMKSALSEMLVAATAINTVNETDPVNSPTNPTTPSIFTQPVKKPDDEELSAFKEQGHSVVSMVSRFNNLTDGSPGTSPEPETAEKTKHTRRNAISPRQNRRTSSPFSHNVLYPHHRRKGTDLGRSESMKGRADQRDSRPARRSKSDVDMDENTLRALNASGSSSTSSLSNRSVESPSNSMDTLTQQIQDDSDFDVEADLPSLKQVLGEETVRRLKPKEKKRQDVINELFYTEKCHVRNLKILDKLFYRSLLKETSIPQEFTKTVFPNLETMISLHSSLNEKMKAKRKEKPVISCVGDILLQRFDEEGENFRNGCALFCRNQSYALESLKARVRKEPKMAQLLADAENNPLCQRLALRDIIPKQIMRLTKYPLLIENLLKYTQTNTDEFSNLERSLQCSKHILEYVNQAVKDCENHQRLIDLQRRIDKKLEDSPGMEEIKVFDLSKHRLVHDGPLTWQINNRKSIELHVILLEKAMMLLQKQEDRLVLKSQSITLVAGKEDNKRHSPLMWLNNVLARDDATDKKSFFVVNTSRAGPQIYKLVASSADEQKRWTKFITQAADAQKKSEITAKKKPVVPKTPVQQEVTEVKEQITRPREDEITTGPIPSFGDIDMDLVHPEDVQCSDPITIATSAPILNPLEQLQENDEKLETVLEERQGLIAELLKVTPSELRNKVETLDDEKSKPQDLIAACQLHTTQLLDMVKDGTLSAVTAQQHAAESGDGVEDMESLTMPIPMDRLRDMANRMNHILTNLLAQTRASSSMTTQAAVNTGEEERNKLRNELKVAQAELNRLRRIQKATGSLIESGTGEVEGQGRPASLVSENSTISESGDEHREDEVQTEPDTTDTNDEITQETSQKTLQSINPDNNGYGEFSQETLTEISPVTVETYPDNDVEIELEPDQELQEMDPPEEDELEESDPPDFQLELSDGFDEGSSVDPIDGTFQGEITTFEEVCELAPAELEKLSQYETADNDDFDETVPTVDRNGNVSDVEQSVVKDDDHHSNGDQASSNGDSKRDSGEVYHDATEALDSNNKDISSKDDLDDTNNDSKVDDVTDSQSEERTCDADDSCVEAPQESVQSETSQTDCAHDSSSNCDSNAGQEGEKEGDQSCESKDIVTVETVSEQPDNDQETDSSVTGLENTMGSEEV